MPAIFCIFNAMENSQTTPRQQIRSRCSPHQLEWTDGDGGRRRGDRAARGAGEDDDDDDVCIFALGRRRRRAR